MTVTPACLNQTVTINVRGTPRPQGSMKMHRLPNGGTAVRYPAAVYEWRGQVQQAVIEAQWEEFDGPVELRLGFDLPRVNSHYLPVNSKRTKRELREDAPTMHCIAPDLDKLVRCVSDAITDAGLWHDDGQVAVLTAAKRYGERPGVLITVTAL